MARKYDVVVLGSGIGGSMLGCILAKNGLSTLLIEELTHPRFTIGESLIPETGVRLRILAEKFGVPEIGWLGSFHALRNSISANCGVKRSFAFLYHREGEAHVPEETDQLPTLTPPFGPDSHLFRQDTDAYLAAMAVKYGAELRQQTKVTKVEFRPDEVVLETAMGETIRTTFLIDGGGMRSHMATQFELRDATPRFRTDTRALYSHFVHVKPADLLIDGGRRRVTPSPLAQATLHHVFDGGWIWVIPFSNHRHATNPLTSVGLVLDRRKHPVAQGTPEEEFRSVIARFPTIRRHFADAKAVRPWFSTGRLQYSQSRHIGPRWIQLPHAACFVDPLYSSGMSVLTVAVDLMAEALLGAFADNDFAVERFQRVEQVVNGAFDHFDRVVSTSFDAFSSYDLWNAWNRNWAMGNFLGTFGPLANLVRYLGSGDRRFLDKTTEPGTLGVLSNQLPDVRAAMLASSNDVAAAVAGGISHAEAGRRIFDRLGALPFLPKYMGFGDPDQHAPSVFTLPAGARHVLWYRLQRDPAWRAHASFPLLTYAGQALGFTAGQAANAARSFWYVVRDILFAGNDEWRHLPNALGAHGRRHAFETFETVAPELEGERIEGVPATETAK